MTAATLRTVETRPAPLPGYVAASIWDGYEPPPYLVKRLLEPGGLTVVFGPSANFKSVMAIDLSGSVGTGAAFHGMRVRKAAVLYVAGEGHGGIRKRLRAWMLSHGIDAASDQPSIFITSQGADLVGNPEQLRSTVDHAAA